MQDFYIVPYQQLADGEADRRTLERLVAYCVKHDIPLEDF